MKRFLALLLSAILLLTGCSATSGTEDLMAGVPERVICLAEVPEGGDAAAEFSLRLFGACLEPGKNALLSPISVLSALAMTANGAEGETLAQMEQVLGLPLEALNPYLYSILDAQGENLKLANSIWFKDDPGLAVAPDFLETNANYYQASLCKTPMDASTLEAVNTWVKEKTDGTIPRILDQIDPELTMLYLINALAFDADWEEEYLAHQVHENTFTTAAGEERTLDFLYSTEYSYLEDENATGFIKYYDGRDYAFVALLPEEGCTPEEYAASLTGARLRALLASPREQKVHTALPKFDTEFSADIGPVLAGLGMPNAFDPELADFSRMGKCEIGKLYISRVLHKTFLSVTETGTRAGAATVVEMRAEGAAAPEEYKEVILDRPFLYLLIDCRENIPLFLGVLQDPIPGK